MEQAPEQQSAQPLHWSSMSRWLTFVSLGLLLITLWLLHPENDLPKLQGVTLLVIGVPLSLLAVFAKQRLLDATPLRLAVGLLFVMVYFHARSAALPEAWVPKNEWDEAWFIPWVSLTLVVILPFWIAHWLLYWRDESDSLGQHAWTLGAIFVVGTALTMYFLLVQSYADAIMFVYTRSVALQAMESALVFAMAAAWRPVLTQRALIVVAVITVLAKTLLA